MDLEKDIYWGIYWILNEEDDIEIGKNRFFFR